MNDSTDALVIDLPAHLDLTAAGPLAERFVAARGEAIAIDTSRVERLAASACRSCSRPSSPGRRT